MSVHEAIALLRTMRENIDQSLTGTQIAAIDLATCILAALPPEDTRTVNLLFANYFN